LDASGSGFGFSRDDSLAAAADAALAELDEDGKDQDAFGGLYGSFGKRARKSVPRVKPLAAAKLMLPSASRGDTAGMQALLSSGPRSGLREKASHGSHSWSGLASRDAFPDDWAAARAIEDAIIAAGIAPPVSESSTISCIGAICKTLLGSEGEHPVGLRMAPGDMWEERACGLDASSGSVQAAWPPGSARLLHAWCMIRAERVSNVAWRAHGKADATADLAKHKLVGVLCCQNDQEGCSFSPGLPSLAIKIALEKLGCACEALFPDSTRLLAYSLSDEGLLRIASMLQRNQEHGPDARPFEGVGALWKAVRAVSLCFC